MILKALSATRILHACLLLIVAAPQILHAQQSSIWVGARVGTDVGTFAFSPRQVPDPHIGWKVGLAIGGELDYWFTENMGAAIEPSYVQKGAYQKISEFGGQPLGATYESAVTFSYVQIPVLFKVTYGQLQFKPYFFVGPSLGFKVSASSSVTFNGETMSSDIADSEVTAINFSLMGGAGVTYSIGSSMQLFLESAYDFGLSNLNPTAGQSTSTTPQEQNPYVYTRDIRASIGILFKL